MGHPAILRLVLVSVPLVSTEIPVNWAVIPSLTEAVAQITVHAV